MGSGVCLLVSAICISFVLSEPAPLPERAVDCRKFVFAPLCRGVAAKRTGMKTNLRNGIIIDASKLREFLKNYNTAGDSVEENVMALEEPVPARRNSRRHMDALPFYDYDHTN